MTLVSRLKSTVARSGRLAAGAVFGVALTVALLGAAPDAFAQAGTATPIVPAEGRGPALWVISDADSTLYLFGTVHVLRPDTPWGSAEVDAALQASDRLILEIPNHDDTAAIVPLIQRYGVSPERPLSSLLTADELADLNSAAATLGFSPAQIDLFRPWFAAMNLSLAPVVRAGYDPQSGVERILKERAQADGKSVSGLETMEQQLEILATLPEDIQLDLLRSTLETYDDATTELDALVEAWATGDVDTIDRIGVREIREESEEIYQVLLARRNADWAGQIETLLQGSGTAFIAVGAAHLAGDDSVQRLLEKRGIVAVRR